MMGADTSRVRSEKGKGPGFVIVAVLLVVAVGALVGASVLANARVVAQRVRLLEDGAEAELAVSAAGHAVSFLLSEQREALLRGGDAELPERIVLFEHGSERAVARLVGVRGALVRPSAARLDVNAATDEQILALEASAGLDPGVGEAIIEMRNARAILSLDDLIDGVVITPETVYGDAEAMAAALEPEGAAGSAGFGEAMRPDRMMDGAAMGGEGVGFAGAGGGVALIDLLTVYSAEPNVQTGIDPERADSLGRNRINLNREFSEDLAEAIRGEYDEDVVNIVRGLIVGQGVRFTSETVIAETLMRFQAPHENWGAVFDSFTTTPDPFLRGRVDVNRAPAGVLGAVGGLTLESSERVVALRESVDEEARRDPCWVLVEGLSTPEEYAAGAPFVAARSLQLELVVETGYEPIESAGGGLSMVGAGGPGGAMGFDEAPALRGRRVTAMTIDLAAPRARIAALRDVTHWGLALGMWTAAREVEDRRVVVDRVGQDELDAVLAGLDAAEAAEPGPEPLPGFDIPDSFIEEPTSAGPDDEDGGDAPGSPEAGGGSGAGGGPGPGAVDRRAGRWRAVRAGGQ